MKHPMDRTRRFRFLDPGRMWCDLCVRWDLMRDAGDKREARLFEVLAMLQEIYPNEVLAERERRGIAPIDHLQRGGHLRLVAGAATEQEP